MIEYIKYFENGGKNMSFIIEDDSLVVRYNEIWNKTKKTLNIKFHSMPVYDKGLDYASGLKAFKTFGYDFFKT